MLVGRQSVSGGCQVPSTSNKNTQRCGVANSSDLSIIVNNYCPLSFINFSPVVTNICCVTFNYSTLSLPRQSIVDLLIIDLDSLQKITLILCKLNMSDSTHLVAGQFSVTHSGTKCRYHSRNNKKEECFFLFSSKRHKNSIKDLLRSNFRNYFFLAM